MLTVSHIPGKKIITNYFNLKKKKKSKSEDIK